MTKTMDTALFKTAFSANAIFIPATRADIAPCQATTVATAFTAALVKIGYTADEKLFHALCHLSNEEIAEINLEIENILGLRLNWMPMIHNWQTPVETDFYATLIAMFANVLPALNDIPGTTLPCGHFIPDGTFPLERYNGCPLCGRTFAVSDYTYTGQGTKLKTLTLWTETELLEYERTLLNSKTPLEGTQTEALKVLMNHFGLPEGIDITIREVASLAFLYLAGKEDYRRAADIVKSPADILRALWSEKSGSARIVKPKDIATREADNVGYRWQPDYEERKEQKRIETIEKLKLKYSRAMCRFVARLLEQMPMDACAMCENMHPDRGMWVRFIRALRLAEYGRRNDFPKLREVLDRFYRGDYTVWAGEVETALLSKDTARALRLLSERPGTFARRLFASMLHLGAAPVLEAFAVAGEQTDIRLLLTVDMYAAYCLDPDNERSVRLAGGSTHLIPPSKYLKETPKEEIAAMTAGVKDVCSALLSRHFAARGKIGGTVYIQKELYDIPVPVGERAQSNSGAYYLPQGSRIPVEGNHIRLFLHWGEGLPAQHLDMDLSAIISYPDHTDDCAYYNLSPAGAVHSGDIQYIPDRVGAAEYIELDIPALEKHGATHVAFIASAYTSGGVSPTAKIGWMDSRNPMKVDNETGVAFDPSTVQFSTRLDTETPYDSIVFGDLDIKSRQVIWAELLIKGQMARSISITQIMAHVSKLENRMSIGRLLEIRAKAQGQTITGLAEEADEVFTTDTATFARKATIV